MHSTELIYRDLWERCGLGTRVRGGVLGEDESDLGLGGYINAREGAARVQNQENWSCLNLNNNPQTEIVLPV
jgi:hypothetical protein